jgi:hypothetical protein
MYSLFFLLDCELGTGDLVLDSISRLEGEATPTSTASIDDITCEYPFFPSPGDTPTIESPEIV